MANINFLGKEVTLKSLSIGDIMEFQKKDIESFETVVEIASKATGVSVDEIKSADLQYIEDLGKVVEAVMGK